MGKTLRLYLFFMGEALKIGLLGCGTVGSGVVKILRKISQNPRYTQKIIIEKIFVRNDRRAQEISTELGLDIGIFTTNPDDITKNPEISIVVEIMGGVDQTKDLLLTAIAHGKHIVTANKDLLARQGEELFENAKKNHTSILFEAAVAGGIPIIATLKQSLQANTITSLMGILNGTTNYILDEMKNKGASFEAALKQAQALGFAEADPTNDVDGHDAAYKTAIIASIISGMRVNVDEVFREGIRKISQEDIQSAKKRGFEIKLLGVIDNSGAELDVRVHPVFVPKSNTLASVGAENNAILIKGDAVQELTLIGKGAGSLPTASSVVGDILMLASSIPERNTSLAQFNCTHSQYAKIKSLDDVQNAFYIRVSMLDKLGVLKDLGALTAKHGANVKFIDQYDVSGSSAHADFIIDPIPERDLRALIADINALDSIRAVESVIRVLIMY
jgi:homoserine dehydrogenase